MQSARSDVRYVMARHVLICAKLYKVVGSQVILEGFEEVQARVFVFLDGLDLLQGGNDSFRRTGCGIPCSVPLKLRKPGSVEIADMIAR